MLFTLDKDMDMGMERHPTHRPFSLTLNVKLSSPKLHDMMNTLDTEYISLSHDLLVLVSKHKSVYCSVLSDDESVVHDKLIY